MTRRTSLFLLSVVTAFALGIALVAMLDAFVDTDPTTPVSTQVAEKETDDPAAGRPVTEPKSVRILDAEDAVDNNASAPPPTALPAAPIPDNAPLDRRIEDALAYLKRFEDAVNKGDCEEATEIWTENPGCGSVQNTVMRAVRVAADDRLIIFEVIVTSRSSDQDNPTKTRFAYAGLEKPDGGWRIEGRYSLANAEAQSSGPNTPAARKERFEAFARKHLKTPMVLRDMPPSSAPPAQAGNADPANEAAPEPGPGGEAAPIPAAPLTGEDTIQSAMDTVRRFYDLVGLKSCAEARSIRADYDSCEDVNRVERLDIHGACATQDVALVNFSIAFLKRQTVETFDGSVRLNRVGTDWIIEGNATRPVLGTSIHPDNFEAFARSRLGGDGVGCQRLSTHLNIYGEAEFKPLDTSAFRAIWSDFAPATFGSAKILNACFGKGRVAGTAAEVKPPRKGPRSYLPPPERARPTLRRAPVLPAFRGSIRSVDTGGRKLIALGFDIGERNNDFAGYDGVIIDYLRRHRVKATLYMGGKWLYTHPERALQLIADPLFEIGNHAWTHGNFRLLSPQQVDEQIYFTEVAYEDLRTQLAAMDCARAHPTEIAKIPEGSVTFRFPYGTCNNRSLAQVNDAGLPAVQWDIVTADPAPRQSAQAIAGEVLKAKPGSIVVLHANGRGWNTARALPLFIPKMRKAGWEFVTVAELLTLGTPVITQECFEREPGDNLKYDRLFGVGTGE